jgi:translocation and assembly module TamB
MAAGDSPPRRRRLRWRLLHWLGIVVTLLLIAVGIGLWAIDTSPGHRFLADRIGALRPADGLRIRIGRIDGSIWNKAELRDVRLSDPNGLFLEIPELALDWRPTAWLSNRLDIRALTSDLVVLHRLPKLRPTGRRTAILPDFDIRIRKLEIARLEAGAAVAGAPRAARIAGSADIRKGRAKIDLVGASTAGDRLLVKLDAEPDRDGFDVEAQVTAPSGGLIGALAGTKRPIAATVTGDGRWSAWQGRAQADISGNRVINLALGVKDGRYALSGTLAPAPLLKGKLQRLSSPAIAVNGSATLADRQLDAQLALRSAALDLTAQGRINLATSAFDAVTIDAALLRPPALFPNMTGSGIALRATLDGPFKTAAFDYRLTAKRAAFDTTGFEGVIAVGKGIFSPAPVTVPVKLTARRVTGVGDVAGGILANLTVNGALKVTAKKLTGNGLAFTSDKLRGKFDLTLDLVTGRYDVAVSGALGRYLIPGLGIVDVMTELKVVPGANGRGTAVAGRGRAWVRRLDNSFFAALADGLPQIETGLRRGSDGVLHFVGLKLTAPGISLTGNGYRRRDGTFWFDGGGSQARYGAVTLLLDGPISKPRLDLAFARPMDALGLDAVRLLLDPSPQGFAWRASGGSTLGPFSGNGQIVFARGQPTLIAIAALDVTGTRASGGLRADPGGFLGRLNVAGGGIDGSLLFAPVGSVQKIEAQLGFNRARLAGVPDLALRRGAVDGTLLLDPAGLSIEGIATARGLRRGNVQLARVSAQGSMRGGTGEVKIGLAGSRGRAFALNSVAKLSPDRIALSGDGTVDRRPIALTSPAILTRTGDGWALAPTGVSFAGGTARLGGRFGGSATEIDAGLDRMPLSVLDIVAPRLALGGHASGRFTYRVPRGGSLPAGSAELRIRGLTRSGLVLSSRPIDLGLNAVLTADRLVARAVGVSDGQIIGRAQARIAPLPADGMLPDRLMRSPVIAQLRYAGPADTLWRLSGIETIDLSGPVSVGADISGRVGDPAIRGSLRTDGARLESAVTGTVIDKIKASGRFGGSRLAMDSFTGRTRNGGTLSGTGSFDLATSSGLGMDLAINAKGAELLNRDDIGATVTGPLTIRSDGASGTIAGDVELDRGRFRLGRAAVAGVPRLDVRELNRPADDEEERAAPMPWRLALKADARNRLAVTGLGLNSEWRATLTLGGTVDNPAITGRADLVRGGYEFAGRRFDLERGSIRFLGQTPPDPVLDIGATASIQGLNAKILVTGTGQKPAIAFASIPALPEDELLSRLLFGTSITNLSAPEALQLAAAVASLRSGGGGGLDPINAIRRVAGLDRLRILPADLTTTQRTSIAAGKYIGRRTYVELITDGQGYSATKIEFQITRWLSLLSTISTVGRQSANVRVSKDY